MNEMRFIFEPAFVGWYPAQLERLPMKIATFVERHPAILFHDFVDHGPDADFSDEDELLALGATIWTKSGNPDYVIGRQGPEAQETIKRGLDRATERWPIAPKLEPTFKDRLGDLMLDIRDWLSENHRRPTLGRFDITLFANGPVVDFRLTQPHSSST